MRPGKGKKGRRRARAVAAAATASAAGSDAGAPAGQGGGADSYASGCLAKLQRDIKYLEGYPCLSGGSAGFVEEQLVALRAQRDVLAAALAADKQASLSRAAKLRREAHTASRAEKKLAVADAEADLQAAHEKLAQAEEQHKAAKERFDTLESALAEAGHECLQVTEVDLAAMRGLFVQLRTLPSAQTTGNLARAWEFTMQQMSAVQAMLPLAQSSPVPPARESWSDSCPLDGGEVDPASDVDLVETQPSVERGRLGRRPPASEAWAKVSPGPVRELAEEAADVDPLATVPSVAAAEAASKRALQLGGTACLCVPGGGQGARDAAGRSGGPALCAVPERPSAGGAPDNSLIMKMDIEGSEWPMYADGQAGLEKLQQLGFEFHELRQTKSHDMYATALRNIQDAGFEVAIHGNINWYFYSVHDSKDDFVIPRVLEVTLVKNMPSLATCQARQHLHPLDRDNNPELWPLPMAKLPGAAGGAQLPGSAARLEGGDDRRERPRTPNPEPQVTRHEAAEGLAAVWAFGAEDGGAPARRAEVLSLLGAYADEAPARAGGIPAGGPALAETCRLAVQGLERDRTKMCACQHRSFDPALGEPGATEADVPRLRQQLMDVDASLYSRYVAMFTLRNLATPPSIGDPLCESLDTDASSAVLRHEVAFILGQLECEEAAAALSRNLARVEDLPSTPW
ncbi:unnamed protein product [Prorocentrum cordatum]|uniref:Methyltransferase FkbM domain-containing protein n=1 Tax=Prorocentrum cordatum TaxID=2364126 RepID=A0ABN9S871_9DINO|nr:unnamed protein product [Polarella glacialis]